MSGVLSARPCGSAAGRATDASHAADSAAVGGALPPGLAASAASAAGGGARSRMWEPALWRGPMSRRPAKGFQARMPPGRQLPPGSGVALPALAPEDSAPWASPLAGGASASASDPSLALSSSQEERLPDALRGRPRRLRAGRALLGLICRPASGKSPSTAAAALAAAESGARAVWISASDSSYMQGKQAVRLRQVDKI